MIINRPSPNHGPRPCPPDTIILHYTGMQSAEASLKRLCDPVAQVSAHYLIDESGALYQLVDPDRRAWHAGVSHWAGRDNANDWSIGIELQNVGHGFGYPPFPEAQIERLLELMARLKQAYSIKSHDVIGHSDIAPNRKQDPGELFPWALLAEHGFGLYPSTEEVTVDQNAVKMSFVDASAQLIAIGYPIAHDVIASDAQFEPTETSIKAALGAFQGHFLSAQPDGVLDIQTGYHLHKVKKAFETARGRDHKAD